MLEDQEPIALLALSSTYIDSLPGANRWAVLLLLS